MTKEKEKFEADAAKFKPTATGCGTLLKAKRDLEHLMRLKDIQTTKLTEGEAVIVLYDFVHVDTEERALILLLPDEQRHMYMTTEFDKDFEVLRAGTQQMMIGGRPLKNLEVDDCDHLPIALSPPTKSPDEKEKE